jgi:hypothetical protein
MKAALETVWEKSYGDEENIWTQSGTCHPQSCAENGTRYP